MYFKVKCSADRCPMFNDLFIRSTIGSVSKLKLLHEDLPPKVDLMEIYANTLNDIMVLIVANSNKPNLLKAPSISSFYINIAINRYFIRSAIMK